VGLAWLASGARPGSRLVTAEIDTERAGLVAGMFADLPGLAVIAGDWREIYRHRRHRRPDLDQARMQWHTRRFPAD